MDLKQPRPQHHLVPIFAGGGTHLPAHIGILQALTDLNVKFDHLVGVSGGSIISSLYASGLSLPEIKKVALETDFEQFKGFFFGFLALFGSVVIELQIDLKQTSHIDTKCTTFKRNQPCIFDVGIELIDQ